MTPPPNDAAAIDPNSPADVPTAQCPWCRIANVAVESMQCADLAVTGVDEDNGPVYWAECQRCGARGPLVDWAADAIPKWNEYAVPVPEDAPALVKLRAEAGRLREAIEAARLLIAEISTQKPEKPDYWSSCGQCDRNISQCEDALLVIDAALAARGEGGG